MAEASYGPLFEHFELALADGARTEAVGPFFYDEKRIDQSSWAIPPLMSSVHNPELETREFDLLYPALTYDRFGAEYRFQLFQLLSFSGGGLQEDGSKDRFALFPIYFQQRSTDTNQNYTAVFPFYGTLKNRLFREEIRFALWPLYVKTVRRPGAGTVGADEFLSLGARWAQSRRGDVTTYNFVAPIFHLRYGDGMRGWQVWPLVGHEAKVETARTNAWNDVETIPGYEKNFCFWPIWIQEARELGTTNERHFSALLPLYTKLRSPLRDSSTYLWPFGLTLTDDRAKRYHETDLLWPVFVYARGEGKTSTRFWPLFGRAHNQELESNFYLWPIYKYKRLHADPIDRERTQLLLFLFSDVREKNTATGKAARRVDCWPLFTHTRDLNGNIRFQMFSLIEPILSKSKSIDRNYSPVWSVWRSERNSATGAKSQSLLWNLYRRQTKPDGERKTSLLFGLFQHRANARGSALRVLYIPLKRLPPDAAAAVDSPAQLPHPAGAVEP